MPHSTQIRTRCVGSGVFDENRRLRNDISHLQFVVRAHSVRAGGRAGYMVSGRQPPPFLDSGSRNKVRGGRARRRRRWPVKLTASADFKTLGGSFGTCFPANSTRGGGEPPSTRRGT